MRQAVLAEKEEPPRVDGSAQLAGPRATASIAVADPQASMFERLVRDPSVDVDKLERLMAMHERMQAIGARAEFYADFAQMQGELPTVMERGRTNNGAYARHEDIVEAVRPALKRHGFILTFRTKFEDKSVRVIGVLAHRSGHAEETEFVSQPDTSGNKNAIQALGSAQSYGQRYTARALLNIASSDSDDDGRSANRREDEPVVPQGYSDWWDEMQATAVEGLNPLKRAFNESKPEFRTFLTRTNAAGWEALKAKAPRGQK
jgi:hypothetical protein